MSKRWVQSRRGPSGPVAPPPQGAVSRSDTRPQWDVRETRSDRRLRDLAVGTLLLVVAGLMVGLGQAPWNLWWLALPGWALGLAIIARSRVPFLAGWLMGTAHLSLALHWIVQPFLVDPGATGWMAPGAVALTAVGLSLFVAGGAALGAALGRAGPARLLGIAAGIGLAELARSWVLTGFPWALPGHVLIGSPALTAAAFGGAHGLGFAVLVGAALIASARVWSVGAGLAFWALPFGLAATLAPAPEPASDAPILRLVQPNAPQHQKWDPDFIDLFWRRGLELTARAGRVDAVIWPETSMPALLERSDDLRPMIARAAASRPAVIGAQRYGEDGEPRNTMALLTGDEGDVALIYDKHHLVPFGEYLPLSGLLGAMGFGAIAANLAGSYAPGEGPITFDLPGIGAVMPMICYEAIFPQYLSRVDRPALLLHLTNDAWFGSNAGPRQHLALARLRAAESGLPLLRAANTGISAAIDARGQVRDRLGLGIAGIVDAPVPPALQPTVYARTGDLLPLMLFVALSAAIIAIRPHGKD